MKKDELIEQELNRWFIPNSLERETARTFMNTAFEMALKQVWKGSEMQFKEKDGKWINCNLENYMFRLKPAPDYTAEIAELENKIKYLKSKML